jgi:hypothetical protein
MEYRQVDTREALNKWARTLGVGVHVVNETWESITYQAEAEFGDGTHLCCRYRHVLPRRLALRRRDHTFVVGLCHEVNGARCYHVRPVIAGLSAATEADAMHQAVLYASAMVELQRRPVCGATAATLSAYTIERAVDWQS